jgi:hypothetical protein
MPTPKYDTCHRIEDVQAPWHKMLSPAFVNHNSLSPISLRRWSPLGVPVGHDLCIPQPTFVAESLDIVFGFLCPLRNSLAMICVSNRSRAKLAALATAGISLHCNTNSGKE